MKDLVIALVGQPNVGKSMLINSISNSRLRVGNFSGVTVEKAEVSFDFHGYAIRIIDLPGTYSLTDYTQDERVTKEFLENEDSTWLFQHLVVTDKTVFNTKLEEIKNEVKNGLRENRYGN